MHKYVFFDTETTSLLANKRGKAGGEVIQFSALVTSTEFEIERVINRYCDTSQLIDPAAENVHKLSNKKISVLSDGKFFEDIVREENLRAFDDCTWIAHNLSFDTRMANQTLIQNGYSSLDFGTSVTTLNPNVSGIFKFDAMRALSAIHGSAHNVKLATLIEAHIKPENFRQACMRHRERYDILDPLHAHGGDLLHNAAFDTYGLYLLVNKFRNILIA